MYTSREILSLNLYTIRTSQGLSIEATALNCNVSTRHFGDIERGKCNTTLDTLDKISKGVSVSVAELLTEKFKEKIHDNKK
ncbi:MAG: helix-turn-helix transcriptional regulator [Clostridia bacterium]|nr:helix-turn-helix transcriptional regulator [Clostridia bacterium]